MPLALFARSLAQRILPSKKSGLTAYYKDGIHSRIAAARWQIERHERASTILEIGCGRDLHTALTAAIIFGKRVIAYDVQPLACVEVLEFTRQHLGGQHEIRQLSDLSRYGIDYVVAPKIPDDLAIQGIVSAAVLEHLPPDALRQLTKIIQNRLQTGNCLTATIDYKDHWSYICRVPPVQFYYHGPITWRFLNNRRMYQNRLRHCDMISLFLSAGMHVAEDIQERMPCSIDRHRIAAYFSHYTDEQLSVASSSLHLVKNS